MLFSLSKNANFHSFKTFTVFSNSLTVTCTLQIVRPKFKSRTCHDTLGTWFHTNVSSPELPRPYLQP